jgi:PhnB protein
MDPPSSYPPMSPSLTVRDASGAIEFYKSAFGAAELYRLTDPTCGVIGHAELMLNGSLLMLAEENPSWGNKSPQTLGGSPTRLCLMVPDTDTAVQRATAAGATVEMPPTDMFYGFRSANVRDPFGHLWMIQHQIEKVSPEEMQSRWAAMAISSGPEYPASNQ